MQRKYSDYTKEELARQALGLPYRSARAGMLDSHTQVWRHLMSEYFAGDRVEFNEVGPNGFLFRDSDFRLHVGLRRVMLVNSMGFSRQARGLNFRLNRGRERWRFHIVLVFYRGMLISTNYAAHGAGRE